MHPVLLSLWLPILFSSYLAPPPPAWLSLHWPPPWHRKRGPPQPGWRRWPMSAQPSSQPVEQVSVQWFLSAGRWCKHLIHIFKWLNKIHISEIPVGAMEATNSLVFGVAEEELFNKCLFKQISLTDLKNELNNRQLDCFQADSYHILTSKLKLHILEQCQAMPLVREDIKNEIAAFYSTGPGRQKKVYQCCLIGCKF